MERTQLIYHIKETVNHVFPKAKTYLFGSQARNSATSESDWDILVLVQTNKNISIDEKRKLWHPLYELEIQTGELISCKIFNESEWYSAYSETTLFTNVQNEAIAI